MPTVNNVMEEDGYLKFTLSGVNVSIANAIRRIILSEIPCVVFRTEPYEENKVFITKNTTRMNNELIKQRLSCVPIHIQDVNASIENYEIIIHKKNDDVVIQYVTTEDIVIRDKLTDKMLSSTLVKSIFPPDPITGDYIIIARLRPRISEDIDGEQLVLSALLDIGTSKEHGAFNVVSTCSYGNTVNPEMVNKILSEMEIELKNAGDDKDTIEFKKKDWVLLNAEIYSIPDSFDFTIETVGQFSNTDIMMKCIHIMLEKIKKFRHVVQTDDIIHTSDSTLEHGFDIKLIGEDYTLGKALEYLLYIRHYDRIKSDKILNFCGFRKPHPHIDESIIRLGFVSSTEKSTVVQIMVETCKILETNFKEIMNFFDSSS